MAAPHPHACSLSTPGEKENKAFLSAGGKGKKVYELCNCSQTRVSSVTSPRLIPCSACRAALGPPTFTLFGKV